MRNRRIINEKLKQHHFRYRNLFQSTTQTRWHTKTTPISVKRVSPADCSHLRSCVQKDREESSSTVPYFWICGSIRVRLLAAVSGPGTECRRRSSWSASRRGQTDLWRGTGRPPRLRRCPEIKLAIKKTKQWNEINGRNECRDRDKMARRWTWILSKLSPDLCKLLDFENVKWNWNKRPLKIRN